MRKLTAVLLLLLIAGYVTGCGGGGASPKTMTIEVIELK